MMGRGMSMMGDILSGGWQKTVRRNNVAQKGDRALVELGFAIIKFNASCGKSVSDQLHTLNALLHCVCIK